MSQPEFLKIEQGSPEWHALRKTKITATDASVIMGVSPWKTRLQLYHEKISEENKTFVNEAMQRGTDLEPIARDLFNIEEGRKMVPVVVVLDWAMASLDGFDFDDFGVLEIKCPGEKDHSIALGGSIPQKYYPQLQHQMYVTGATIAYYYSFDGIEGAKVLVERDDKYIAKMVAEEKKFYDCMQTRTPPEPEEGDYVSRQDEEWTNAVSRWLEVDERIKNLQTYEESLREDLIMLSGDNNSLGGGISLSRVTRKGAVNYGLIPELRGIDLEPYRKDSSSSWRILRK